jgi:hypothetical protein
VAIRGIRVTDFSFVDDLRDLQASKQIIANRDSSPTAHLPRINSPQLAFAVIAHPDGAKTIANSIGLWIFAVLIDHFVRRRIDARYRVAIHCDPDKSAAIADFSALTWDMHRN